MQNHTLHGSLAVARPFDLALSLEFLRGFSPMMGEQTIAGGTLAKAWLHRGQPVVAEISALSEDRLAYVLASPGAISAQTEQVIAQRIQAFLGAGDEISELHAIAEQDPMFAPVARRLYGLHHVRFASPFEAACWAVINQRIQLARARQIKARLVEAYGAAGCDAFPEATALATRSEDELAEVMRDRRRAKAVAAVSRAFATVDEAWLATAPEAEVTAWLRAIWGVGEFATGFVMFRGLGRAISLPWGDKFVEAARVTYGASATPEELEERARAYGSWKGYWSLYLWAATFVDQRRSATRSAATAPRPTMIAASHSRSPA